MNIIKILGYGLSGLCFLLFVLSFRLISQEQQQKTPRKSILNMILFFMTLTLLSTVTVGWFGIVQNNNSELRSNNDSLLNAQSVLLAQYVNFMNSMNEKKLNEMDPANKADLITEVANVAKNTDSLTNTLSTLAPEEAKEVKKQSEAIDKLLVEIKNTPKEDTIALKKLSTQVIKSNDNIQKISKDILTATRSNRFLDEAAVRRN